MADDRRISSLLGGIARSVGPSDQDIRSLERRREQHERKTAKRPVKAFDEMLDNERQASERDEKRRQEAREDKDSKKNKEEGGAKGDGDPSAGGKRRPPMARGRGRLIRG